MRYQNVSILALLLLGFCSIAASAQCNCEPDLSLQEHFKRSDAVFVGEIISAIEVGTSSHAEVAIELTVEVETTWKRDLSQHIVVIEPSGSLDGFDIGSKWLFYARDNEAGGYTIFRGCCSRTKPFDVAAKQGDLKALKSMRQKKKRILD